MPRCSAVSSRRWTSSIRCSTSSSPEPSEPGHSPDHVRLLLPHIGDLEPHQVHDATLAPFIASRIAAGASATTINRSLEVVRAILNRAARSYRASDGTPWLTGVAPLITMLLESRRAPYPITWA